MRRPVVAARIAADRQMNIPIARPQIGQEEEEAVLAVLRSGRLSQGPEVAAFEREFAGASGTRHAVACASGTSALQMSLLALGVGPGDDVLVPALSFAATANAVIACGARPVFCDVKEDDFAIDVEDAASRVTPATRVVIPVHLYGQAADMEAVCGLARRHGLMVVEDACQAHGATHKGQRVGSFGVGAFSTYATKNLTTGEGGVVTTSSDDIETRLRLLRNHGMPRRNVHTVFGLNLRMGEVQAAIGRVQLARLPANNAKRKENAAFFTAALQGIEDLILPRELAGRDHVWHQYTVRILGGDHKRRDRVLSALRSSGVGAEVYYPIPLHKQPAFRGARVSLPAAERLAGEVLSIPVHPSLCADERAAVSQALAEAMVKACDEGQFRR